MAPGGGRLDNHRISSFRPRLITHRFDLLFFNCVQELYSVGTRWKFGLLRGLNDVEPLVGNGKTDRKIPAGHASTVSDHALIPKCHSTSRIIARDGDAGSFPPGVHLRTGPDGGEDTAKGDPVGDANEDAEALSERLDNGEKGS